MYIRRDQAGRLLLLACKKDRGKLALGNNECIRSFAHILIKTEGFQHPDCIDIRVYNPDSHRSAPLQPIQCDKTKYSAAYLMPTLRPDTEVIEIGWQDDHYPYPEIQNMEVWCFGIYMGNHSYPKIDSEEAYRQVAVVKISEIGLVTVNGINAGIWPEWY